MNKGDISSIHRVYIDKNHIHVDRKIIEKDFGLHWHDCYELEYFISGKGYQIFNGTRYDITPGNFHLVSPTDFHEIYVEEPFEVIKIHFMEDAVDPFVFKVLAGIIYTPNFYLTGEKKVFFDKLLDVYYQETLNFMNSPYYSIISKNFLECVLVHIIEYMQTDYDNKDKEKVKSEIHEVISYVHNNFRKPISLKTVAELVHFSPNYLSKIFHSSMKVTFKDYVQNLRISFAYKLILTTDLSITNVCYESGFGSLSNFINEFKKAYHISPSELRKKHKNDYI